MKQSLEIEFRSEPDLRGLLLNVVRYPRAIYYAFKHETQIAQRNKRMLDSLRRAGRDLWVELGSGPKAGTDGWTTVDTCGGCDLQWDLKNRFPFDDDEVSRIYCSHVLEHFSVGDTKMLLSECRRVLRPGGTLSVAVPNSQIYLDAYQSPSGFETDKFCNYRPAWHGNGRIDIVNYMAYMDGNHLYMFDRENLISVIQSAGFSRVTLREFDESTDLKQRDYESIYALAIK